MDKTIYYWFKGLERGLAALDPQALKFCFLHTTCGKSVL